jgi:CubicO group peptidase (beta-lactamase class C family)
MTDTGFWVPGSEQARLAALYQPEAGGAVAERMVGLPWELEPQGRLVRVIHTGDGDFLRSPRLCSAGAGLVSTTDDMLRFSRMLLGGGSLGPVRLLGRRTVTLMTADHLPNGHPALAVNGRGYGLGVSVVRRPGEARDLASIGEFGWGGAACTQVWIDPAEDLIALLMLQYRPRSRFPLMDLFYQSVRQSLID